LTHKKYPNIEIHIKDDTIYMPTFVQPLHIHSLGYIQISPKISYFTNTKNPPPCSHNPFTGYNLCLCHPFCYCQALSLSYFKIRVTNDYVFILLLEGWR